MVSSLECYTKTEEVENYGEAFGLENVLINFKEQFVLAYFSIQTCRSSS